MERALLSAALVVGAAHVLDESLWHRSAGVTWNRHLPAVIAVTGVVALLLLVAHRLAPLALAAVSAVAGTLILANGSIHVAHVWLSARVEMVDITGIVAAVAGVLLVGVAVRATFVAWRHGATDTGVVRRWTRRVGVALAVATTALLALVPVVVGIVQTHSLRLAVGEPPGTGYRSVHFDAADGLHLEGWYRASTNGAAVVLVSSARGDRTAVTGHARLLAEHGYGVLLYDARGTGNSDGDPNGYGWDWDRDVVGAVSFLQSQPDVRHGRIGALGLSTGADVLLEAGARDHRLGAIVADGATARSPEDAQPRPQDDPLGWWYSSLLFGSVGLWSGQRPGPPLAELAPRISPTPLLLVAGGSIPQELPANARYARAAREPVTLWRLPEVDHTAALTQVHEEYERVVVGFLDRSLLQ